MKLSDKLKNQKSGFTLLEIIIVIIIVGVLASLALPRLTAVTQRANATEGLNTFREIRTQANFCTMPPGQDYTDCIAATQAATFALLGMELEGNSAFTYSFTNITATTYTATATFDDGAAGDTIVMTVNDAADPSITIVGNGIFNGFNF